MTYIELFDALRLHPLIVAECRKNYADGSYSDAIFTAFKCVEIKVREASGLEGEGKGLMSQAFNFRNDNPKVQLNPLTSKSDRNEQDGFMHIYMGAMVGVRNPKGHDLIRQDNPFKTLEYLGLASLLLRRIDERIEK